MKINRVILAVFVAIVQSQRQTLAAYPEQSVPPGADFVSPDRQYSVKLVNVDRQARYAIGEIKTGRVDDSIVMPTLLLYLRWSANSRSIVTVEHIAHGSCGRVIYSKDGAWSGAEIKPPGEKMMYYTVANLTMDINYAHYRFAVRHIKNNGIPIDYGFSDVDVELQTGRISKARWAPISQHEEVSSLARKPTYSPPMNKQ